jgi:hypothetical protein
MLSGALGQLLGNTIFRVVPAASHCPTKAPKEFIIRLSITEVKKISVGNLSDGGYRLGVAVGSATVNINAKSARIAPG